MKVYGNNPREMELHPNRELEAVMTLPSGETKTVRFETDAPYAKLRAFCMRDYGATSVEFKLPHSLEVPEDVEGMEDTDG